LHHRRRNYQLGAGIRNWFLGGLLVGRPSEWRFQASNFLLILMLAGLLNLILGRRLAALATDAGSAATDYGGVARSSVCEHTWFQMAVALSRDRIFSLPAAYLHCLR